MGVTERFIGTNHIRDKLILVLSELFERFLNGFLPRRKGFETIPALFLNIVLYLVSIRLPTRSKRLFQQRRRDTQERCELLTDLVPTLI